MTGDFTARVYFLDHAPALRAVHGLALQPIEQMLNQYDYEQALLALRRLRAAA